MSGKLIIISAPSGAGKSTIVNYLMSKDLNLEFSISATTRKPRGDETNGKEYYFISVEEFRKRIAEGDFIEWQEVYKDQLYGTLREEIDRIINKGNNVLFDVDVRGGINLKNLFGNKAMSIFLMPPSENELERRLRLRGTDSPSKIRIRIAKAKEEMKLADMFDHIVINTRLELAEKETYEIVKSFIEMRWAK
ncbi:MAG TPA: guanylate kinase [Bacteroidales bacterium]|nr:guanylate kinase [Bacteroidales bacterium]